jgi:chromosome segregation ATPase
MARLEGDSGHQLQSMRGELDQALQRLRAYELLEDEIDAAVVRTATMGGVKNPESFIPSFSANIDNDDEDMKITAAATTTTTTERLLQSVKGIPTNPERRVKQSIYLAQKLLEIERHRDELQHQLVVLQKELKEAKQQAHIAIDNLARTSQPTSYLVSKLREEEVNKSAYANKCKLLEDNLNRCKVKVSAQKTENIQLRERLKSLFETRSELEHVKNLLVQLKNNQRIEEEEDDDEDDDDDDDDDDDGGDELEQGDESNVDRKDDDQHTNIALVEHNKNESTPTDVKSVAMLQGLFPSSPPPPSRTAVSTAAALGLSPEQLALMTSPPTHSSNSNHCSPVQ